MLANLSGQCPHELDRVELRLVVKDHAAVLRERYVESLLPPDRETRGQGGFVLGSSRRQLLAACGVCHRRASLQGDAVVVAEPQQPLLALEVALDVRLDKAAGVVLRIRDSLLPWRSETLAVLCPVVPAPTRRASTTATRRPARASSSAVVRPVSPPPTTRSSRGPSCSSRSVCLSDVSSPQTVTPPPEIGRWFVPDGATAMPHALPFRPA